MANITVTIPDPLVPDLLVIAEEALTSRGIDFSSMTSNQKAKAYIAVLLRHEYVSRKRQLATAAADATITATAIQALADASGIT